MPPGPSTSVGFVSTFPPTVCGIATYCASLVDAVDKQRDIRRLGVVRLTEGPAGDVEPPVIFHHRTDKPTSLRTSAALLNSYDSVSIQHEYGIFGGRDGDEVLELMAAVVVPTVVTLHTVLDRPSRNQGRIMEGMAEMATRLVVMSNTAARRLVDRYGVDPASIVVIAHGADPLFALGSLTTGDRPLILTWGLIGPGKGLEWAIEGLADLVDMEPRPRYLIAGATHPHVRLGSGERYRRGLEQLIQKLGLGEMIEFDDRYLRREALARLVRSADVVVLPYESVEQVTSGVLVEAIAASKPVIATPFPHAVELLSGGAGALVPFHQPHRLAQEVRRVIADPVTRASMRKQAAKTAAGWYWPTVGDRFAGLMSEVVTAEVPHTTPGLARRRVAG